jgi:hypothetical protein
MLFFRGRQLWLDILPLAVITIGISSVDNEEKALQVSDGIWSCCEEAFLLLWLSIRSLAVFRAERQEEANEFPAHSWPPSKIPKQG